MKLSFRNNVYLPLLALLLFAVVVPAFGQGTAFTYQGQLNSNSVPANGNFELMFLVFATDSGGVAIANAVVKNGVAVSNGLFVVSLDFGTNAFTGGARWLEIAVGNGANSFVTLVPRQPLTPTPNAITAGNLAGMLAAEQLAGTYSNPLALNNVANFFAGDGSGLTSLNAAQINGAVPLASLTNVWSHVWRNTGNAGTTPGTQFLGTTDNQPLELKVNGARALRLEPNTIGAPNVISGSPVNAVVRA